MAGQQRHENVVNGMLYEFVVYREPFDEGSLIDESPTDPFNTHAHTSHPQPPFGNGTPSRNNADVLPAFDRTRNPEWCLHPFRRIVVPMT